MTGDIGLYEVRVVSPKKEYTYRGRVQKQGGKKVLVHRLMVAAFSHDSAESLGKMFCYRMLGEHVDDVMVKHVEGRVLDLGMFALPRTIMSNFQMQADIQIADEKKRLEEKYG